MANQETGAEEWERLGVEEEEKFVRKLKDPKLPSKDEIEMHNVMGHFPYRDWCPICVKAHGKEMGHQRDGGKKGMFQSIAGIIVFLGMN